MQSLLYERLKQLVMKRFLSIFYFITFTAYASVQTHNVYFLGHSLVNFNMPAMFEDLCIDAGISGHQQAVTVGNGASLSWQWTSPSSAQGPEYPTELATGLHDVFVMTEAVPLKNHLQWSNTYGFANNFHDLAQQYVANCQTYMYETWHCISSGTPTGCAYDDDDHIAWRTRLTNDLILWESIADSVNLTTTGPPMFIIPAGQCMAALYDSIEAGAFLPTYDSIIDIFDDDIHLTDVGNYFISLVMYATIYKSSPVGLTNQTSDIWNVPFNAPSVADATKMQELVWNVVCNYARSGVSCGANAIANTIDKKK